MKQFEIATTGNKKYDIYIIRIKENEFEIVSPNDDINIFKNFNEIKNTSVFPESERDEIYNKIKSKIIAEFASITDSIIQLKIDEYLVYVEEEITLAKIESRKPFIAGFVLESRHPPCHTKNWTEWFYFPIPNFYEWNRNIETICDYSLLSEEMSKEISEEFHSKKEKLLKDIRAAQGKLNNNEKYYKLYKLVF